MSHLKPLLLTLPFQHFEWLVGWLKCWLCWHVVIVVMDVRLCPTGANGVLLLG